MARKNFGIVVLVTVTILAATAVAQSNQVAVTLGRSFIGRQAVTGTFLADDNIHFGRSLTFGANYSHQFFNFGILGISAEVPFVFDPSTKLNFGIPQDVAKNFSSYFITPAAKVAFFPTTAFSPWISLGGGFGHFSPSSTTEGGTPTTDKANTTGVFEIGGGLDVRIFGPIKLRGEIRDFQTGEPAIDLAPKSRARDVYVGAGLAFSF